MSKSPIRNRVAVSGVGYSEISRDSPKSEGQLAVDACRSAIKDAGLTADQIDGITSHPDRTTPPVPFQGPSISYVQRSLALRNLRYWQAFGLGPGQFSSVFGGIYAIAAGACTHLVTYRALKRQRQRYMPRAADVSRAWDEEAFSLPYGGAGGAPRLAMWATRHMHEYGTTQEQLGAVVVTCRGHGSINPSAYWKTPVTLDEYMESRWIATPFKLLDCDYPVDAAVAIVLSAAEATHELPRPPIYVESVGGSPGPETSWTGWPDLTRMGSYYAAREMWSQSSLTPADVDVAELYDGFSWLALCWLEDLGFVKKGEGGPWFESGAGRLGGQLPVCTDGGFLSMGRLHGYSKLAQAVKQLRGEAGPNQVPNANVAVATVGGGPVCGAMVLVRDPS